jgi:hypothetical protein
MFLMIFGVCSSRPRCHCPQPIGTHRPAFVCLGTGDPVWVLPTGTELIQLQIGHLRAAHGSSFPVESRLEAGLRFVGTGGGNCISTAVSSTARYRTMNRLISHRSSCDEPVGVLDRDDTPEAPSKPQVAVMTP